MTNAPGRILLLLAVTGLAGACGGATSKTCASPCDGVCANGRCLTTLVASRSTTLGPIALDATSVYYVSGGVPTGGPPEIFEFAKAGGSGATIASSEDMASALAVDATSVYWTFDSYGGSGGVVQSWSLDGKSQAATLASGLHLPDHIAVDASNLYFTESNPGRVSRVPLAGGTPTVLATGLDSPGSIAVDATSVYWVEGGTDSRPPPDGDTKLMAIPLAGGVPTTLATAGVLASGSQLAIDARNAYWTISVYSAVNGKSVSTEGKVLSVPLGGGAATTLAAGQNGPGAIAVDATAVYWLNQGSTDDGSVMKLLLAGGAPVTLATGRTRPVGIAVDATDVYWTENGPGAVMRTPKD